MKKLIWSVLLIGSLLSLSACSSGDKDMGGQKMSEDSHVQSEMSGNGTNDMMENQDMEKDNMNSKDKNMMEPSQKGMDTKSTDMSEKDANPKSMSKGGM